MSQEWNPPSIECIDASFLQSYSYASHVPASVLADPTVECVLGVDEAGRGPVLGPMVYGVAYCPVTYTDEQISSHGFMDSKVLDHRTRTDLLSRMCNHEDELYKSIGWTVRVMSARDISAGMLKPKAPYNLNAQAHDTTIQLIRDVLSLGVNVRKIFVDTVGVPETYQAKLAREFPMAEVVVAKKADSLYPIVSVASICAKVTRDKALEKAAAKIGMKTAIVDETEEDIKQKVETSDEIGWGSGYPSDARTANWLKANKNPIFGWLENSGVRYSWSTAKDLLEPPAGKRADAVKVTWHDEKEDEEGQLQLSFEKKEGFTVSSYFGKSVGVKGF